MRAQGDLNLNKVIVICGQNWSLGIRYIVKAHLLGLIVNCIDRYEHSQNRPISFMFL